MLRKSTLLAVAASAALGLAMLAPTSASAKHGGGHGGGGMQRRPRRWRPRWRRSAMAATAVISAITIIHPHWHVRYHRPIWYGVRPVVHRLRPRLVSPGPCTCLSKEYTPEGAVLFKDRCTNEAAMNPPAQAPPQTGKLEPQQQPYQQQYVQPQPQPK